MAWAKRIGCIVSAIIYVTFAVTAIALARSTNAPTDGNATVSSLSADVMAHSGGRGQGVVLVIALGFVAYGLFCVATFTHRELQAP